MVEASAIHRPDLVAVEQGASRLTYAGLERIANQMAHQLLQLGVRRETPVGLHARRQPLLVAAILAIHKAGGCHVPKVHDARETPAEESSTLTPIGRLTTGPQRRKSGRSTLARRSRDACEK